MVILIPLLISVSINFMQNINNSIWEVYDVKKIYESDNYAEAYTIDLMFKKEIIGEKVIIKGGYLQMGKEKIFGKMKIIEITEDSIICKENGVRGSIKYELFEKNKKCDFTFQDGSILNTKKIE